jgi:hypothetical protein
MRSKIQRSEEEECIQYHSSVFNVLIEMTEFAGSFLENVIASFGRMKSMNNLYGLVSRLEAIVISLKQQPSRPKRGSIRQQTLIVEFGSATDVKSLAFVQNAKIA